MLERSDRGFQGAGPTHACRLSSPLDYEISAVATSPPATQGQAPDVPAGDDGVDYGTAAWPA
jgi:hypothetical protein